MCEDSDLGPGPLGIDYFNDLYCGNSGFVAFLVVLVIIGWCTFLIYLRK